MAEQDGGPVPAHPRTLTHITHTCGARDPELAGLSIRLGARDALHPHKAAALQAEAPRLLPAAAAPGRVEAGCTLQALWRGRPNIAATAGRCGLLRWRALLHGAVHWHQQPLSCRVQLLAAACARRLWLPLLLLLLLQGPAPRSAAAAQRCAHNRHLPVGFWRLLHQLLPLLLPLLRRALAGGGIGTARWRSPLALAWRPLLVAGCSPVVIT